MKKAIKKTFNVVQQFRLIVGVYSLTAIKYGENGTWSCSVYRGGKRIGVASECAVEEYKGKTVSTCIDVGIFDQREEDAMMEYVDKAGPYGFVGLEDFVGDVMAYVKLLKEMRASAKEGKLVAVDLMRLDDNGMPTQIQSTSKKANPEWIRAYQKMHPEVQVINDQLEVK